MLAPLLAVALAAAPTPLQVVKDSNAEVQKILGSGEATVERLQKKADDVIDFAELSKRAMGKDWAKLAAKQRDELVATMRGLLRASYAQRAVADGKEGGTFEWGTEKVTGNEAVVTSTLVAKKDRFPIEYKLSRADAKAPWRMYDVITDGVSLVQTYNDQFRQLIAKKGLDGLLSTLKAKKDQLEKQPAAAQAAPAPAAAGATTATTETKPSGG